MPIDMKKAADLVFKEHLAFVCSLCEHYHEGRAQGRLCGRPCGGPIVRKTFPDYKGPIPIENLSTFCFVCGNPGNDLSSVKVVGDPRLLAVCKDHAKLLDRLKPATPLPEIEGKPLLVIPRVSG